MHNKKLHIAAFLLLVVGGLNWLAIGVLGQGLEVVTTPISPMLTKVIYILVGLSAVYELLMHKKTCKMCADGSH